MSCQHCKGKCQSVIDCLSKQERTSFMSEATVQMAKYPPPSSPLKCKGCGVEFGLCFPQEPSVTWRQDGAVRCNSCYKGLLPGKETAKLNSMVAPTPPAKQTEKQAEVSNPKTRDSSHKVPLSLVPPAVRVAIARVLKIGGEKPGRWHWNWRDEPVKLSQYLDAIHRHLAQFESGQDNDEEMSELAGSPINHLDAAISSLAILIDAREAGVLVDDRPTKGQGGAAKMLKRFQVKK